MKKLLGSLRSRPHTTTSHGKHSSKSETIPSSHKPSKPAKSDTVPHTDAYPADQSQSSSNPASTLAFNAFKITLKILREIFEDVPVPGKGVIGAVIEIINIAEVSQENTQELNSLDYHCQCIAQSIATVLRGKDENDIPESLSNSLWAMTSGLQRVRDEFEAFQSGKFVSALNGQSRKGDLVEMNRRITRLLNLFWLETHISGALTLQEVLQAVKRESESSGDILQTIQRHALSERVRRLPYSPASYDSYTSPERQTCLAGTRVKLLGDIAQWIGAVDVKPIYVLEGIAGFGKSTIAQTVATRAADIGCLGASFFFSRSEDGRNSAKSVFPTIAFQLCQYNEEFAIRIGGALESSPDAAQKVLSEQFRRLIVDPLRDFSAAGQTRASYTVIIIDALDECDTGGAETLLRLLLTEISWLPFLKVIITTRPEPHIKDVLLRHDNHRTSILHETPDAVIGGDIRRFLESYLSSTRVREIFPYMDPPWGADGADIDVLVKVSGNLFIVASTAVYFVLDKVVADPENQMSTLLQNSLSSGDDPFQSLDALYTQILRIAIPITSPKVAFRRFQEVVGTIILLFEPLPLASIAKLIGMKLVHIGTTLRYLHSVILSGANNTSPRIYHKSFFDFMIDPERCKDSNFFVLPKEHHCRIAASCLLVMKTQLRKNMCGLRYPEMYLKNCDVPGLKSLIEASVSPELLYACCYWGMHLRNCGEYAAGLLGEVEEFVFEHLLHWLEVLSLIGRVEMVYPALEAATDAATSSLAPEKLETMLGDCQRFVMRFYDVIKHSSLHIYYSALPFTPSATMLYRVYQDTHKDRIHLTMGHDLAWSPILAVMHAPAPQISVQFSPDGMRLVACSVDSTARLWNGTTGAHIADLVGHSYDHHTVEFSPDNARLASGSANGNVALWNGVDGAPIAMMEGHSERVSSVTFSPDSGRLVSGSGDGTVRVWDAVKGVHILELGPNFGSQDLASGEVDALVQDAPAVDIVKFSPDGRRFALGSDDGTIHLLHGSTFSFVETLVGHSDSITSLVFCRDSSRIGSGSRDRSVRLWDASTGANLVVLSGHSRPITSLAFSPDGFRLVSGSYDGTIRIWDGISGALISTMENESVPITSVAFSPDGTRLASSSFFHNVRIWDPITGELVTQLEAHTGHIHSVAYAPDGALLASASEDRTVRLWVCGAETHTVEAVRIWDIAISPDGSRLAAATQDSTIQLLETAKVTQVARLRGHSGAAICVSFSADGKQLASGSLDGTVRLWNAETATPVLTLAAHDSHVVALAYTHDSTLLASGYRDGAVRVWNSSTGVHLATYEGHSGGITALAFSTSSTRVASASLEDTRVTIHLWDWTTALRVASLEGPDRKTIKALIFSPDGAFLYAKVNEELFSLYKADTGALRPMSDDEKTDFPSWLPKLGVSSRNNDGRFAIHDRHLIPICWLPNDFRITAAAFTESSAALAVDDHGLLYCNLSKVVLS